MTTGETVKGTRVGVGGRVGVMVAVSVGGIDELVTVERLVAGTGEFCAMGMNGSYEGNGTGWAVAGAQDARNMVSSKLRRVLRKYMGRILPKSQTGQT